MLLLWIEGIISKLAFESLSLPTLICHRKSNSGKWSTPKNSNLNHEQVITDA